MWVEPLLHHIIHRHSGATRCVEPGIHSSVKAAPWIPGSASGGPGMTVVALLFLLLAATPAEARLDLSRASVERLDNGLTLILLEDRTFPVVSIQTVYRTGAKDDPAGRLGLAHFFEHMAFRGSKNFPDTGLVSEIYAAGGEWHGYTWIDLTTYFATAPKGDLALLLDIEADRMARLDVRKEDVGAERGAVLAEMNGYLNDPDSTLFDALVAAHFLTHPYRNNTIGYASDVNAITHADLRDFYRRHYAPQNAVIALVGDFNRADAGAAIRKKFGRIKKPVEAQAPLTAELPRSGERRLRLSLPSEEKLFKIAYPAPAASHPDFPAFLVLQALIGKSSGVNFNQNDWGTPVGDNSPLAAAGDVRTWIIPTAEQYAFVVSGSAAEHSQEAKTEATIQSVFDSLAKRSISTEALAAAKEETRAALAFDVGTTEDAAHQLAYFAGIGALDQLLSLEERIGAVTAADVAAIAGKYLRADQRTIAWLQPGPPTPQSAPPIVEDAAERSGATAASTPASAPVALDVGRRPSLIFQRSNLSETVSTTALLDGRRDCPSCTIDAVAFGATTVSASSTPGDFELAFQKIAREIRAAKEHIAGSPSYDPLTRLEEVFSSLSTSRGDDPLAPKPEFPAGVRMIAVSGDIDADAVKKALTENFPDRGDTIIDVASKRPAFPDDDIDIAVDKPLAQYAVGYIAEAPDAARALSTDIALYILSHGYEGRLGKEAISRRGLAYYIDTQYRAGPGSGAVTIAAGVDPGKVDAFRALLKSEITRLSAAPPTDAEIAEAKRHLLGRKISAAQSNEEIADALIHDFFATGGPESAEAFAVRLDKVSREDVLDAARALQKGAVVTIRGKGVD